MADNEHPRKCSNLLTDFMKWTLPRSEAKESYIFWTGLYTMSCVLRRHVKISRELLGSWETFPYLYLLFVGPSGNRKTTTANYNIELLDEVGGLVGAPDQITVPKLASALAEADECSIYINAGELSEFIVKSGVDMYSFLTKAFDGAKRISVGTHMRGVELAEKPCINFLGATTPEWIGDNIPQSILDGGFGSRCVFIYEETVRLRQLFYREANVKQLYEDHHANLVHDLKFIANNIFGDFQLTPKGEKNLEEWYKDGSGASKNTKSIKMKGYYERKPAYVMKLAMLLKIADGDIIQRDQLILDWQDFEEGIQVMEGIEKNMHLILGGIGKNVYKGDMKSIYEYIVEHPNIRLSELLFEFKNAAEPAKLSELISGLSSMGLIELEMDKEDFIVKLRKKIPTA